MCNQKGYVAGCNGQAVVTADQVIAGAMLSQHPVGRTLLYPLPGTCREQLAETGIRPKPRTVLAGSGYAGEENFARTDADGLAHRAVRSACVARRAQMTWFCTLKPAAADDLTAHESEPWRGARGTD